MIEQSNVLLGVAVPLSVKGLQQKFQIMIAKSSQSVSHSTTEPAALLLLLFVKESIQCSSGSRSSIDNQ
jgi:hypothetical protein